jgi:hypothetical protein
MSKTCIRIQATIEIETDTAWTAKEVCRMFSKALDGAVLISAEDKLHPLEPRRPGRAKVINWTDRYLDEEERKIILTAAAQDVRRKHGSGLSNEDFYRAMGWGTPSAVYKRRLRICEKVALLLRRDGVPRFSL